MRWQRPHDEWQVPAWPAVAILACCEWVFARFGRWERWRQRRR